MLLLRIYNPTLEAIHPFIVKLDGCALDATSTEDAAWIVGNNSSRHGWQSVGSGTVYRTTAQAFAMLPIASWNRSLRPMPFHYDRTVHFADTDAAGFVFFANFLVICHEAYEESLSASGIDLKTFFADNGVVVPVAKSEAEYRRPLFCGDKVRISVKPALLSEDSYEIRFEMTRLGAPGKSAARVRTEHVCIDSGARSRKALPEPLSAWVRAG